jgi:hypothetical protein
MADTNKETLLLERLLKSFTKKRLTILADIIEKKRPCSMRVIEWFVATHAKTTPVIYKVNGEQFDVYSSYKNQQIKSYRKSCFDMYRRTDRIPITIDKNRSFETTIAQLNFFDWMFRYKIIDYIIDRLPSIKKEMESIKSAPVPRKKKEVKKFFDKVSVVRVNITINFE